jgi:GNAT superfamily N-acetyltransferase
MELREITKVSEDKAVLEEINTEAIPDNERTSLDDLFATGMDGNLEVLGVYEENRPVGFFVVRKYKNTRYLAYFAIKAECRSKGIGSKALALLINRYPNCQIVVEFEAPRKDAKENDMTVRRRNFYLRNGFHETGCFTFYDGVEFEIACSRPIFVEQEFEGFVEYFVTIVPNYMPKPYRK